MGTTSDYKRKEGAALDGASRPVRDNEESADNSGVQTAERDVWLQGRLPAGRASCGHTGGRGLMPMAAHDIGCARDRGKGARGTAPTNQSAVSKDRVLCAKWFPNKR